MSDPLVEASDGHTEISDEERHELRPTWIATRGDLFVAEQANIADGLLGVRPVAAELLDDVYLRALHRRMFDQVWRWAGRYRARETNLGIDPTAIAPAVRTLVADVAAWIEHEVYRPDEIAVRFHHRLVSIHPFVNGNGRHSRIAADLLVQALGETPFTWGRNLRLETGDLRSAYRTALQRADRDPDDIAGLLAFARS